jgi:hypothetical protein
MPLQNSFTSLIEDVDTDIKEKTTTHIVKPPPIYADAQILDPLIGLLNSITGTENYSIKQLKQEQAKM